MFFVISRCYREKFTVLLFFRRHCKWVLWSSLKKIKKRFWWKSVYQMGPQNKCNDIFPRELKWFGQCQLYTQYFLQKVLMHGRPNTDYNGVTVYTTALRMGRRLIIAYLKQWPSTLPYVVWFHFQLTVGIVVNGHLGLLPQLPWITIDRRHCEAKHSPPCATCQYRFKRNNICTYT